MAKCPHCNRLISDLKIEATTLRGGAGIAYKGVTYSCPMMSCGKIISVQMDPVALKADLIKKLKG
jgi:hypothetical protein